MRFRALLGHFETRNWLYRVEGSRAVVLTPEGQRQFDRLFARQPATG